MIKKIEFYKNSFNDVRVGLNNGSIKSFTVNGVKYTKGSDLLTATKSEQKKIRKHNNPIEFDKAIKYSLK